MTIVATGALQSIPEDLYEAASMDGASGRQQFLYYTRFIELRPTTLTLLLLYLQRRLGQVTAITFIDSTALPIYHNRRIVRHKVFDGLAARGKTSLGSSASSYI